MAISSLPSHDDVGAGGGDAIVAEINITPLTDVFLVLLIIFMVTASAIQSQGKNVNLPEAAVSDTSPQGVTVTVTKDGLVQVNDETVAPDQLVPALTAALEDSREKFVVLRGDRQVLLGQAVNILDVAQQAGARGIGLATRKPRGG
jgi:biopolymer transport protein ExbD